MIDWRIYYANLTEYGSDHGEPWQAPATRVLAINQRPLDPRERPYHVWRSDYYIWKYGRWFGVDLFALYQYLFVDQLSHPKAMLAGETVNNDIWLEVTKRIKADPEFFGGEG